jgi:hypothetical protein
MKRIARAGSATGVKSAITYVGSGTKGPHVIYLAEGKRITVGRDKSTKGPAWLVIEDTPVVKAQSPNIGMNESPSHQPSMTSEQLDRFQDWLNREAVEANKKSGAYFNGRACAFNDAFECLTILRMNDSQPPESTESDKSPNAPGSARFAATADGTWLLTIDYGDMKISVDIGETDVGVVVKHGVREDLFDFAYPPNASPSATEAGR